MPGTETALLLLESVLLIATITLLVLSIKEGRSRDELLARISKTTKILSREDYFTTVISAFQEAEKEVFGCITGSTPTGGDRKHIEDIMKQIERLTKSGVTVRYMLPKFPDRLGIGHMYTKAGAEVRYTNCLFLNDHRSMIVDSKLVIVGVPEAVGEVEPTKKGFRIPSEGLARILKDHYFGCWNHNMAYAEYLKAVLEQTGGSVELLAKELEIDVAEISGIVKKDTA